MLARVAVLSLAVLTLSASHAAAIPTRLPTGGSSFRVAAYRPAKIAIAPASLTRTPRSVSVITTEIKGIEKSQAGPPVNNDLDLGRRLMFACDELAASAALERARATADDEREKLAALEQDARAKAVAAALDVVKKHAGDPRIDDALYYVATNHAREGRAPDSRRNHYQLVASIPDSKLVPWSYLAFGDLFFAEADADPSKYELATQAYGEVMKRAPADSVLLAYAALMNGYSSWLGGASGAAKKLFIKARDTARKNPDDATARLILAAADKAIGDM